MQAVEERIFSRIGGWLCLDFVNTGGSYAGSEPQNDYIPGYADLITWARQVDIITREQEAALNRRAGKSPELAGECMQRAKLLRTTLHSLFTAVAREQAPDERALALLNSELGEAMSHARISAGADGGYEWAWEGLAEDLDSLLWPVVRSAADLLVNREKLERVSRCASDSCGWLFVDTSKNHSRRWCDMRDCGNTAKARRHYHRKVAETHTH